LCGCFEAYGLLFANNFYKQFYSFNLFLNFLNPMKKLLLTFSCVFIFVVSYSQNVFLDPYWGYPQSPWSGDVWRYNGSIAINAYSSGTPESGFILRNDFAGYDADWGGHWLGFQRGNSAKLNLAVGTQPADAVMMNGYWGIGMRTMSGKMAMTQNGVVLIGEIPKSTIRAIATKANYWDNPYKLYVADGIRTEKIKVDLQATWGDYVFDKHYKLTPLSIVECTIQEKGHLHDMPSAAELKKDGLDLGNMATMQQVKIEELFLHLIDMDKRLKAVEIENTKLKADLNNNKK
jgi:hypothetical protein